MDIAILGGVALVALIVLGNMRLIVACALIAGAGVLYYTNLSRSGQEHWHKVGAEYKKRCIRAWGAFRKPV